MAQGAIYGPPGERGDGIAAGFRLPALRGLPRHGGGAGLSLLQALYVGLYAASAHPRNAPHLPAGSSSRQRAIPRMGALGRQRTIRRSRSASPAVQAGGRVAPEPVLFGGRLYSSIFNCLMTR